MINSLAPELVSLVFSLLLRRRDRVGDDMAKVQPIPPKTLLSDARLVTDRVTTLLRPRWDSQ